MSGAATILRLYSSLPPEGAATPPVLARMAGVHARSAQRYLLLLERHGLAVRVTESGKKPSRWRKG